MNKSFEGNGASWLGMIGVGIGLIVALIVDRLVLDTTMDRPLVIAGITALVARSGSWRSAGVRPHAGEGQSVEAAGGIGRTCRADASTLSSWRCGCADRVGYAHPIEPIGNEL